MVPHGIAVGIDQMKERKGIVDIDATIVCERDSHKGIIIGKQGAMLKKIGSNARYEMERLLDTKVNLKLFIKTLIQNFILTLLTYQKMNLLTLYLNTLSHCDD